MGAVSGKGKNSSLAEISQGYKTLGLMNNVHLLIFILNCKTAPSDLTNNVCLLFCRQCVSIVVAEKK